METKSASAGGVLLAEATIGDHGELNVGKVIFDLLPGTRVQLMIAPIPEVLSQGEHPLQGSVIRYDDPFGSAASLDDWEAIRSC